MPRVTDEEFNKVIAAVATFRRRTPGAPVTSMFEPITNKYELREFRDYLASRFEVKREKGFMTVDKKCIPNGEFFLIEKSNLRVLNKGFYRKDRLIISFDYDKDWSNIIKFFSIVVSGDMTGGLFGEILMSFAAIVRKMILFFHGRNTPS